MNRLRLRRTTAALAAGVIVSAALVAPAAGVSSAPKINWGSCGSDPALAAFQCASVEVPTDYDRPRGATTTIALTRLPASDPAHRIGTLFTNPGGPGGPGVDFVQQAATVAYTPEVRAKFDILGFDPRGVGKSDPVTCYPTAAEEAAALADLPAFPVGQAEERRYQVASAKLATACATTSPDRMRHYSTANVARDMDLLRQAVGDKKLTYAGYSYGTYLGATYAKLFPNNVRALMLDGTLLPEWYSGSDGDRRPVGVRIRQGEGGVEVLAQFNVECKKAGPGACALAKLGDPATVVRDLYKRLKAKPVTVTLPDGSTVKITYALVVQQSFFALYGPDGWRDFAEALAELYAASEAPAARTATLASGKLSQELQEWDRRRREEYTSAGSSLQPCIEAHQTGRPFSYPAYADAADKAAPDFGRFRAWVGHTCEFIPLRDSDAFLGPWPNKVKSPVLVFGTRYDPATPYQATRPYTELYPDGRMVTLNGWGHTTLGQSACADATITAYLVEVKAPADGAVCQPDRRPFDSLPSAKASVVKRLVGF